MIEYSVRMLSIPIDDDMSQTSEQVESICVVEITYFQNQSLGVSFMTQYMLQQSFKLLSDKNSTNNKMCQSVIESRKEMNEYLQ